VDSQAPDDRPSSDLLGIVDHQAVEAVDPHALHLVQHSVQNGQTFKGRCQLNILPPAGGRAPAVACLAGHSGMLSGIVHGSRISIDIHPWAADNMVLLKGKLGDEGNIEGQCHYWSFFGFEAFGSFEATPIVFEELADGPQNGTL